MRVHQQQQIQRQKQLQYQPQRQLEMQNQVLAGQGQAPPQMVMSQDISQGLPQDPMRMPPSMGQGLAEGSPMKGQPVFVQYNQINFFD